MKKEYLQILKDFIKDAEQYKSWQGKLCFRQFGTFEYYNLLCAKLHLDIQCINAYNYTAKNDFLELEYCERDIILTFNLLSRNEIDGGQYGKDFLELSIFNNDLRTVSVATDKNFKGLLFGCWLQDGKNWQTLGYLKV